jgi:hypothetical protein
VAEPAVEAEHKVKVFISYSRRDRAFAERLVAALEARGLEPKLDTRDLPKLEDWRRELTGFIRAADAVVFVVSPHSVKSAVCSWEVEQVATLSKRLAPVVLEPVANDRIPPAISKINYLNFDPPNDFDRQADALAGALQIDLHWIKDHTRLGELAHRWDERGRPAGLTLRGQELEEAERWIASRPRGAPEPTAVHKSFVSESRRAATRRLRYSVVGALAVGVLAIGLALFAFFQQRAAEASRANAIKVLATSDFQRGTGLVQNDDTVPEGMASLARAVRRGQDKRALTRLWTMLQQRNFWFPAQYQAPPPDFSSLQSDPPPIPDDVKNRFSKFTIDGAVVDTKFMAMSGDGSKVFTTVGDIVSAVDVRYRVWRVDGSPLTDWILPEYKGNTYVYEARGSFTFDGRYLALEVVGWREAAYLEIYDMQAQKRLGDRIAASGLQPAYQNVSFSHVQFALRPPSKPGDEADVLLLAASPKGDAMVFQIADGSIEQLATNRHAEAVVFAGLDSKNEWLMSSGSDGTLRVSSLRAGEPVGNVLQLPNAAVSIARDGSGGLAVTYGDGERRSFALHGAARLPLPADLKIDEKRNDCRKWGDEARFGLPGVKNLMTPKGELTELGPRQLAVGNPGGPQTTSPLFSADIVLVCLGITGDRVIVTTSDFVTEAWALDFSRRWGLPIVERRLFDARNTPATTELTILSPDGKSAMVESFLFDPPNLNRSWYSFWDLDTALPLMDRMYFSDDSLTDGVVESVRMDASGRYLVFVNEGNEKKKMSSVTSLQMTAPDSVLSWIADFAEAIGGVSLDDEGALVPVPDRLAKLQQGAEKLAGLAAEERPK